MTVPGVLFTHCITRRVFHYFCPAKLVAGVCGQRMVAAVRTVRGQQWGAVLASVVPGDWT